MGSHHFSYDSAGARRPSFTIYPRHSVHELLSEDPMSNNNVYLLRHSAKNVLLSSKPCTTQGCKPDGLQSWHGVHPNNLTSACDSIPSVIPNWPRAEP